MNAEIYDALLNISKSISRNKEGALFVVVPSDIKNLYEPLFPQIAQPFSILDKGIAPVVEKLATLDGSIIISDKGEVIAYGAKLLRTRNVPGHGTKHAAASGITYEVKNSTAIVVSEETGMIKVFKEGNMALEMDNRGMPKSVHEKVLSFLTNGDTALFAAAGASAAILGSAALPPVLIAGGAYFAIKQAKEVIEKFK